MFGAQDLLAARWAMCSAQVARFASNSGTMSKTPTRCRRRAGGQRLIPQLLPDQQLDLPP